MTNSYQYQNQVAQDRLGFRITARLSDATDSLPHDISERLRAARVQAVGQRKMALKYAVSDLALSGGEGSVTFGKQHFGWWGRLAAAIPLLALVVGLIAINVIQDDNRDRELADIDAALLTDDLPPEAYADPGFLQFLKINAAQDR